jgi:hypothetical protein
MKPKDIFGLAVRLLGLLFLYFGLKAAAPMLNLDFFNPFDKNDFINTLIPVVFNLVVAVWLIGGGWGLLGWAYPERLERPKLFQPVSEPASPQPKPATPSPQAVPQPELTGMARAEEKLAALVEKPK